MKRFDAWLMLHYLIMKIDDGIYWMWFQPHLLTMKLAEFCLDRSRNHIPDEYQDQLIKRDDI